MAPYPYQPKSTKTLLPGEFWPIVLPSGRYACGRVVELSPPGGVLPTRAFLAGLLDWTGDAPPTSESIAGRLCLLQLVCHVKTITQEGQKILGFRLLSEDGIEPWKMVAGNKIQRGFTYVRPWNVLTDRGLPSLSYAGPDFLDLKAARLLENGSA